MRRPFVFSLGFIGLILGLAGRWEAFSEEKGGFRPEEIRVGRIDAREAPFEELAEQLQQASGVKVEMDSGLAERSVFLRLNDVSLQSVLEVALPSQGATWEWRAETGLRRRRRIRRRSDRFPLCCLGAGLVAASEKAESGQDRYLRVRPRDHWRHLGAVPRPILCLCAHLCRLRHRGRLPISLGRGLRQARTVGIG